MDVEFLAAGFRVIYAADFNPAAIETYRRNLGDHVEQVDLTKVDLTKVDLTTRDPPRIPDADVRFSVPPCFPKGAPVPTREGRKPIGQVQVGDAVLTHAGRYRPVLEVMRRPYVGPSVVVIFGCGARPHHMHPRPSVSCGIDSSSASVHYR